MAKREEEWRERTRKSISEVVNRMSPAEIDAMNKLPPPPRANDESAGCLMLLKVIVCCFVIVLILGVIGGMSSGTSSGKRTDGVFESATEKFNKGLPLNDRENQRLNDLFNYKKNKQTEEIERRHGER